MTTDWYATHPAAPVQSLSANPSAPTVQPTQAAPTPVTSANSWGHQFSPEGMAQQRAAFGQAIPGWDYSQGGPGQEQINAFAGVHPGSPTNNIFGGGLNPAYSQLLYGPNAKADDGKPGSPSWLAAFSQQQMARRQIGQARHDARRAGINPGQLMQNGIINSGGQ